ncbi:hypothetical protein [Clostridium prolinivorans]|uniref:hypothetical protein n=1 Tax=Clostridium prolinivorans TaxID=2769420 RepID=UPI000FDA42AF|nr:hypothetical protein [Clostridium prolinivorans]
MKNFLIAAAVDIIIIMASYFLFKNIISGSTRHKIYEKFLSSFAKFVIIIFLASLAITGIAAFIMYRTRYIQYINIIAPSLVSILVGFVVSTVPTKGTGDKDKVEKQK